MSRSRGTLGAVRRGKSRNVVSGTGGGTGGGGVGGGGGGSSVDTGITQLTGDVTAGPGNGSQAATIAALAVTTAKLNALAVTTAKIDALAVTDAKLAADSVLTSKILDLNVTTAKLAAGAVTTAKITDANVTLAKLADLAALSVIGRAGNTAGVPAAITAGSDGDVLQRSGTSLVWAAPAAPVIAAGSIALAKLADLANQRVIGRNTAGTGVPEAVSLTQLLDWIGSPAHGDLLYRGAASWARLAAGSAGQVLSANGGSANPSWIDSGAIPSSLGLYGVSHFFALTTGMTAAVFNAPIGIVSTNPNVTTGTNALVVSAGEGVYQSYASGALTNQNAAVLMTNGAWIDWGFPFDITIIIRTGADITASRWWVGIAASGPGATDTFGSPSRYVGVRFSTVAGDGGWVGINNDGTTQAGATATIAAIAASTRYKIRIRSTGSAAFFSVNGSAEVTQASNFPTGATRVGCMVDVHTAANVAKTILFQRVFGTVGL